MAGPSPETVEKARLKLEQAKARIQRLEARASVERRKMDARRKFIAGAILLDALKNGSGIRDLADLMSRITRDVDLKAFEGWSVTDVLATPPIAPSPPARLRRGLIQALPLTGFLALGLFCLLTWTPPATAAQFAQGVGGIACFGGAAVFIAWRYLYRR